MTYTNYMTKPKKKEKRKEKKRKDFYLKFVPKNNNSMPSP
jgi:hypothetical protein